MGYTDSWGSSFFPTLYAWEETVASRNAFLTLRQTMLEADADLKTMQSLTGNFLDLYISYFRMTNMRDTTELLREASREVQKTSSKGELQELLEEPGGGPMLAHKSQPPGFQRQHSPQVSRACG